MDDLKAAMQEHISSTLVGFSLAGAYQANETTLIEAIEGAYSDAEKADATLNALNFTLSYIAAKEGLPEGEVITMLKEKTIGAGSRLA